MRDGLLADAPRLAGLHIGHHVVIADLCRLRDVLRFRPGDERNDLLYHCLYRSGAISFKGKPLAELRIIQGHIFWIEGFVNNACISACSPGTSAPKRPRSVPGTCRCLKDAWRCCGAAYAGVRLFPSARRGLSVV